jgi:hypothetical protein
LIRFLAETGVLPALLIPIDEPTPRKTTCNAEVSGRNRFSRLDIFRQGTLNPLQRRSAASVS